MDKEIDTILEAIVKLVDRDDTRWSAKRDALKEACAQNETFDTAFEEFISWFEVGEAS